MHLRFLKIYCDIVRLGSFSKAADANGVSQSNTTQVVQQLEERLGVTLLDRKRRPIAPTAEGQLYFDGCRDVVQRFETLELAVRARGEAAAGRVTVGAIYSVGFGQMHRLVHEFRQANPTAELRIDYMHPDEVYAAVESGEVDLGIVSYAEPSKRLEAEAWREERFAVAVAPGHPLAPIGVVTIERLAGERAVMPQPGLRIREAMDRYLADHGVRVEVVAELDNLESVKGAVEAGEGVALMPVATFAREVSLGALRRLDLDFGEDTPFVRPLGIVRRRDETLGPAAERFVELLRAHANDPPDGIDAPLNPVATPTA
ncbi:MAG: LysR family transcriptional regulator [Lacipirellulaceae bacterium]